MNGHISGQVALIEDDYTLIINRGAQAGVTPGMIFALHSESDQMITDPESGRELGRLSREKLRVRVFDVQPLFARAHTLARTDDFYGLFRATAVVTVDVGDSVELIRTEGDSRRVASGMVDPEVGTGQDFMTTKRDSAFRTPAIASVEMSTGRSHSHVSSAGLRRESAPPSSRRERISSLA